LTKPTGRARMWFKMYREKSSGLQKETKRRNHDFLTIKTSDFNKL
jgi:hypothetical protein